MNSARPRKRAAQFRGRKTMSIATKDRRRHTRLTACIPVTLHRDGETIEGYTENFCYSGVLIQSLGELPIAKEECGLTLYLPIGEVHAHARVVRVHPDTRQFAMEICTIEKNGAGLLALVLHPQAGGLA
jgi:hypothetical protein